MEAKSHDHTDHILSSLRRRAEAHLDLMSQDTAEMSIQDVQRLTYELQVHQLELDMQNDSSTAPRVNS